MEVDPEKKRRFWAYSLVGILLIITLWYYHINPLYMYIIAYTWFGFAYGILLQWGRFCFASAWRDLFAIGVTRMFVGIMVAMGVFSIIMAVLASKQLSTFHPGPFGWHELVGGLIFGLGMTLAGGCASGTLYKTGEGNGTSALALVGIVFGQAIFVDAGGWFDNVLQNYIFPPNNPLFTLASKFAGEGTTLTDLLWYNSVVNVIIPILGLFLIVYALVARKGIMRRMMEEKSAAADGGEVNPSFNDDLKGFWRMVTASRRTTIAGVLIGIIAGVHVMAMQGMRDKFGIDNFGEILAQLGATGLSNQGTVFDPGYWYITTQEAQVGAWVLEKFGFNMMDNIYFGVMNGIPALWQNPALLMSIGIILGAAVIALINKEFSLKPPTGELAVWGLLGGLLMGAGARIALGCNIGGFYIRAAGGDPGGWLFFLGMGGGAFSAVKFFNWWSERQMEKMEDFDIEIE